MPTTRKSQDAARAYLKKKGKGAPARTRSSSERLDDLESSAGAGGAAPSAPGSRSSSSVPNLLPGNPSTTLVASEAVCVVALVTYDMLASSGQQKLPRPAPIVSALGFYALLAAFGSISGWTAQFAGAVGAALALTVLVTGKRGAGLLGLLSKLTGYAKNAGSPSAQTG